MENSDSEKSQNVERYSCSRCKFHTTSKRQLQHHIKQRHSPGKYVCEECGEKFNRALMYKLHMTTHTNKSDHACPTCNKTFPLVSMLKIHQETHTTESIHPCPHCSKQFRQKSALSKHVAFGHTKKNVHPCTACGKIFPSPSTLLLHMDSHKSTDQNASSDGAGVMLRRLRFYRRPNDQNMFKCKRCQRKFFASYALAKHMEGHHGMTSYKCIQCNMNFKTKKELYKHTSLHVHECDECGKKYKTLEQLEAHKKLQCKERELACNLCGRQFSKGISFRRHMESHAHNPKYQCPECGKNFRRQADLNTHQWLHKGDGFPCEDCGKKFGTKQHLIWHSYIHYTGKSQTKSESEIKTEKSESDMAEDMTDKEVKKEPGTSENESNTHTATPKKTPKKNQSTEKEQNDKISTPRKSTKKTSVSEVEPKSQTATPKKTIKKEKTKTPNKKDPKDEKKKTPHKKDNQEDKDKKKEKKSSASPAKKSNSSKAGKNSSSNESPQKKSSDNEKLVNDGKEIHIKKEKLDESKPKSTNNTPSKSGKTPKKSHKRRSKGKRKTKKPSANDSGEPAATDTDSKTITETESEKDTKSEKNQNEKVLTTEESLLSDDVLQDSNELHDAKELRVDTVMFDDIEDDVELDINAAIETLTKLGNHTENGVAPEAFDEVVIDEELDQQTVKDIREEDMVGLEDIGNIEAASKEITHVDIQTLYDMETDNEAGAETEAEAAKAAGVFCAMQATADQHAPNELGAVTDADQVVSDTSAAMLIESEIVTQADRLIQTGLYVQNVMGAQDCSTVLEALNSAVQNQTLTVEGQLLEAQGNAGNKGDASSSAILTQNVLDNMGSANVEGTMSVETVETAAKEGINPPEELVTLAGIEAESIPAFSSMVQEENAASLDTAQAIAGEKGIEGEQSKATCETELRTDQDNQDTPCDVLVKSSSLAEIPSVIIDEAKIDTPDKENTQQDSEPMDNGETKETLVEKEIVENSNEVPETVSKNDDTDDKVVVDTDMPTENSNENSEGQTTSISGSYVATIETFTQANETEDTTTKTVTDLDEIADKIEDGPCNHMEENGQEGPCNRVDVNGLELDSPQQCVSGCSKCSNEFGLSIKKTVCPHSKELKVIIEKLDMKECPNSEKAETVPPVPKPETVPTVPKEMQPAPKKRRTASTELAALIGNQDDLPERSPSKMHVGMSRLRRRIRHSSGTKSVSTKCENMRNCETRRKESHSYNESADHLLDQDPNTPRVSTRSSNARVGRSLRTSQPLKEWKKISPNSEKRHTKKFTSVPRRRSENEQLSPPPQYKVSTLTDLTIRITTQSSPEISPSQQKKSPASREEPSKRSRVQEKEDNALRHVYGATQELCVVLDDINELVLLQQERLQKYKGFKPVQLGKKGEEHKKRKRSGDIVPETNEPPKPIKIFLRLPKDRIKKHEKRLASIDKHRSYVSNNTEAIDSREYQQPDSSQDMPRDKSRKRAHDGHATHRVRGSPSEDSVSVDGKGSSNSDSLTLSPESIPLEEWQGDGASRHRVIGSVISLNTSVLSVEECDSTSMSETQRQATGASSSPSEGSRRKSTPRRKRQSPNKDQSPEHMIVEPLDLTVKYKELADMEVKPELDRAEDSVDTDGDFCTCDGESHVTEGHQAQGSPDASVKMEDEVEGGGEGSAGLCDQNGQNGCSDFSSDDNQVAPVLNGMVMETGGQEGDYCTEQDQATGTEDAEEPATEFIEVIDRGIQCELGDELLFMPDVPPQAVD